jgi:hypothetical protein
VTVVEDLIETAAIEIARTRHRRLGSHGKTPVLSGSVSRCWHFTMLRDDEESFCPNKLWVIQGRLSSIPRFMNSKRKAMSMVKAGPALVSKAQFNERSECGAHTFGEPQIG